MKSKKLLFSSLLMIGGIATYLTFASNSGGVMGKSTSGCGGTGCHGVVSTNTSITMISLPAMTNGYIPGNTYQITVGIINAAKTKSGFDLTVTGGTMSNAPSGTMLMGGSELHHTSPMTAVSGVTGTQFTWTAPQASVAPASITLRVAANAVNGDGGTSGDDWNTQTFTFNNAYPASVSDLENTQFNVYPNPASENLTIKTDETIQSVRAVSLTGSMINLTSSKINNEEYKIDTKSLASGAYILLINDGKHTSHKKFIKQ